jgi:hypothetical protein
MIIEPRLKEYAKLKGRQWADDGKMIKYYRADERQGLIRAKARRKGGYAKLVATYNKARIEPILMILLTN